MPTCSEKKKTVSKKPFKSANKDCSMLIGYVRVSTQDQNLELQIGALTKAGCRKIFEDKITGSRAERPGLSSTFVECPEVSGKTIQSLRIYNDTGDGTELLIDLTDGTSFSFNLAVKSVAEAAVICSGIGEPEVLHRYDLE